MLGEEISLTQLLLDELTIFENTGRQPERLTELLNQETTNWEIRQAYLRQYPSLTQWVKSFPERSINGTVETEPTSESGDGKRRKGRGGNRRKTDKPVQGRTYSSGYE